MAKKKTRRDTVEIARSIVERAIGERLDGTPLPAEEPTNPKRGSAGGKIGGKRRAEKLTPEERQRIAREAARSRWSNPSC